MNNNKEIFGLHRITKKHLKDLCKKHRLYQTPHLNDQLYLHFQGFQAIENLEEYTGLKCLWLESNAISEIQGLDCQGELKCLFLQNNLIKKIENLQNCPELDTLNLASNHITRIENCGVDVLPVLSTLNLSRNYLRNSESLQDLTNCKNLWSLDLSHNRIDDILVVKIFGCMPELRVLVLQGNPVVSQVPQYRKTLILECKNLTYLDSRPVFPKDRACAEAWKRGGYEEERKEHDRWIRMDRKKIRDCVNATLRIRQKHGADVQLLESSDEEDEELRLPKKLKKGPAESRQVQGAIEWIKEDPAAVATANQFKNSDSSSSSLDVSLTSLENVSSTSIEGDPKVSGIQKLFTEKPAEKVDKSEKEEEGEEQVTEQREEATPQVSEERTEEEVVTVLPAEEETKPVEPAEPIFERIDVGGDILDDLTSARSSIVMKSNSSISGLPVPWNNTESSSSSGSSSDSETSSFEEDLSDDEGPPKESKPSKDDLNDSDVEMISTEKEKEPEAEAEEAHEESEERQGPKLSRSSIISLHEMESVGNMSSESQFADSEQSLYEDAVGERSFRGSVQAIGEEVEEETLEETHVASTKPPAEESQVQPSNSKHESSKEWPSMEKPSKESPAGEASHLRDPRFPSKEFYETFFGDGFDTDDEDDESGLFNTFQTTLASYPGVEKPADVTLEQPVPGSDASEETPNVQTSAEAYLESILSEASEDIDQMTTASSDDTSSTLDEVKPLLKEDEAKVLDDPEISSWLRNFLKGLREEQERCDIKSHEDPAVDEFEDETLDQTDARIESMLGRRKDQGTQSGTGVPANAESMDENIPPEAGVDQGNQTRDSPAENTEATSWSENVLKAPKQMPSPPPEAADEVKDDESVSESEDDANPTEAKSQGAQWLQEILTSTETQPAAPVRERKPKPQDGEPLVSQTFDQVADAQSRLGVIGAANLTLGKIETSMVQKVDLTKLREKQAPEAAPLKPSNERVDDTIEEAPPIEGEQEEEEPKKIECPAWLHNILKSLREKDDEGNDDNSPKADENDRSAESLEDSALENDENEDLDTTITPDETMSDDEDSLTKKDKDEGLEDDPEDVTLTAATRSEGAMTPTASESTLMVPPDQESIFGDGDTVIESPKSGEVVIEGENEEEEAESEEDPENVSVRSVEEEIVKVDNSKPLELNEEAAEAVEAAIQPVAGGGDEAEVADVVSVENVEAEVHNVAVNEELEDAVNAEQETEEGTGDVEATVEAVPEAGVEEEAGDLDTTNVVETEPEAGAEEEPADVDTMNVEESVTEAGIEEEAGDGDTISPENVEPEAVAPESGEVEEAVPAANEEGASEVPKPKPRVSPTPSAGEGDAKEGLEKGTADVGFLYIQNVEEEFVLIDKKVVTVYETEAVGAIGQPTTTDEEVPLDVEEEAEDAAMQLTDEEKPKEADDLPTIVIEVIEEKTTQPTTDLEVAKAEALTVDAVGHPANELEEEAAEDEDEDADKNVEEDAADAVIGPTHQAEDEDVDENVEEGAADAVFGPQNKAQDADAGKDVEEEAPDVAIESSDEAPNEDGDVKDGQEPEEEATAPGHLSAHPAEDEAADECIKTQNEATIDAVVSSPTKNVENEAQDTKAVEESAVAVVEAAIAEPTHEALNEAEGDAIDIEVREESPASASQPTTGEEPAPILEQSAYEAEDIEGPRKTDTASEEVLDTEGASIEDRVVHEVTIEQQAVIQPANAAALEDEEDDEEAEKNDEAFDEDTEDASQQTPKDEEIENEGDIQSGENQALPSVDESEKDDAKEGESLEAAIQDAFEEAPGKEEDEEAKEEEANDQAQEPTEKEECKNTDQSKEDTPEKEPTSWWDITLLAARKMANAAKAAKVEPPPEEESPDKELAQQDSEQVEPTTDEVATSGESLASKLSVEATDLLESILAETRRKLQVCKPVLPSDLLPPPPKEDLEAKKSADAEEKNSDEEEEEEPPQEESKAPTLRDVLDTFNKVLETLAIKQRERAQRLKDLINNPLTKEISAQTGEQINRQVEEMKRDKRSKVSQIVDQVYAQRDKYNNTIELVNGRLMVCNQATGTMEDLPPPSTPKYTSCGVSTTATPTTWNDSESDDYGTAMSGDDDDCDVEQHASDTKIFKPSYLSSPARSEAHIAATTSAQENIERDDFDEECAKKQRDSLNRVLKLHSDIDAEVFSDVTKWMDTGVEIPTVEPTVQRRKGIEEVMLLKNLLSENTENVDGAWLEEASLEEITTIFEIPKPDE